jgi:D-alanine--poly(phosphoribitol) ligase subunit 2
MSAHRLADRIGRIVSDTLHLEVPSADVDLFETGVLDSLAFVELLLQLEREFGVSVTLDELEVDNFRSIERIAGFVEARTIETPLRLVHAAHPAHAARAAGR